MTTAPNRRWFRFSLRTLFVAITIIAVATYLGTQLAAYNNAVDAYETSYASWQAAGSLSDVCDASFRVCHAESALPFLRQKSAASRNLARLRVIRERVYQSADNALFGDADEPRRLRESVDRYFAAAESLSNQKSDEGVAIRWLILAGIVAAVGWVSWRSFGPERKFCRDVLQRTPMSDDAFVAEITLERPDLARTCVEVRHIFAKLIGCQPELLKLDDDFAWDDHPVSGSELVKSVENHFGVNISDADAERTRPSIRSVAGLVEKLRRGQATTPQA